MTFLPTESVSYGCGPLGSMRVRNCEVGDDEAAAFLDRLALTEPNIYHVRGQMQSNAIYLRTGRTGAGNPE